MKDTPQSIAEDLKDLQSRARDLGMHVTAELIRRAVKQAEKEEPKQ